IGPAMFIREVRTMYEPPAHVKFGESDVSMINGMERYWQRTTNLTLVILFDKAGVTSVAMPSVILPRDEMTPTCSGPALYLCLKNGLTSGMTKPAPRPVSAVGIMNLIIVFELFMFLNFRKSTILCLSCLFACFINKTGKAAASDRAIDIAKEILYPVAEPFTPVDNPIERLNRSGMKPPIKLPTTAMVMDNAD